MVRKVLTIDISDFEARKGEIASQLISAARDVGFFYIAGMTSSQRPFALTVFRIPCYGRYLCVRVRSNIKPLDGTVRTLLTLETGCTCLMGI